MTTATATKRQIRGAFSPRKRLQIKFPKQGRTKQAQKQESDINWIMEKYQKTGLISHIAKHAPAYGIYSETDFKESMDLITSAQSMFAELPSSVRNRFENDPAKLLGYLEDPENTHGLEGLLNPALLVVPDETEKPVDELSDTKKSAETQENS